MLPSHEGCHELSTSYGVEFEVLIAWGSGVGYIRAFDLVLLVLGKLALIELLNDYLFRNGE